MLTQLRYRQCMVNSDNDRDLAVGFPMDPSTAEVSYSKREGFYRSVLDCLSEGVLITNRESEIVYANRAIVEITGYSRDELIGRISYELLAPKQNWKLMQQRLKERLSGKNETYEHELIRKDGAVTWITVKATPYRNSQGEILGTVGTLSCIESQKNLELQNEYLRDEIRSTGGDSQIVGKASRLEKSKTKSKWWPRHARTC